MYLWEDSMEFLGFLFLGVDEDIQFKQFSKKKEFEKTINGCLQGEADSCTDT